MPRAPRIRRRHARAGLAAAVAALAGSPALAVEVFKPRVISVRPHDTQAFTQGLLLDSGSFYESTGRTGESQLREVDPGTGTVLRSIDLDPTVWGEGLALVGQELYQITWLSRIAYVYALADFRPLRTYSYTGQGWGLCFDGTRLVMSDGSDKLFFRDPATFAVTGQVTVLRDGVAVPDLNELECVGDLVYANVFGLDTILRIERSTGEVLTVIDASRLLTPAEEANANVLNGIAYDATTDRFFLTGKLWPKVFEVEFDFNSSRRDSCAERLRSVRGVLAVEDGSGGVRLSWNPQPAALQMHVNSVASAGNLPLPGPHRPDLPGGLGMAQCDAPFGRATCTDAGAIGDTSPLLYYQVFAACGPAGLDEGP